MLERVTDSTQQLEDAVREAGRSGKLARYVQPHGRLFSDGLFTTDDEGNQVEASKRITGVVATWGDGKELSKEQQEIRSEIMARLFEGYLYDGKTFSPKLKTIFAKLAQWMRRVYKGMETNGVTLTDDIIRAYDDLLTRKDSGVARAEMEGVLAQTKLKNSPTPVQQEQLAKIASSLEEYENLFTPEEKAEKAYAIRHNVVASVSGHDITDYEGKGPIEKGKNWAKDSIESPVESVIGKIYIEPSSIRNTLGHGFGAEKLNVIPVIPDILGKGMFLGGIQDLDGKKIKNYFFAGRIAIGEKEKVVFCRVRQSNGDSLGSRFYVHEVFSEEEIEKETPISGTTGNNRETHRGRSLYLNILRVFLNDKTLNQGKPDVLAQAAYHGSAYLFDKFRTDKVNSGEGSQYFGWGLYFTQSKQIAAEYAQRQGDLKFKDGGRVAELPDLLSVMGGSESLKKFEDTVDRISGKPGRWKEVLDNFCVGIGASDNDILQAIDYASFETRPEGNTFKEMMASRSSGLTGKENAVKAALEDFLNTEEGLRFYDLSHTWGQRPHYVYSVELPDGKYLDWNAPMPEEDRQLIRSRFL